MDRSASQPENDSVLIEGAFLGYQAAFESLVNRYHPLLLTNARRYERSNHSKTSSSVKVILFLVRKRSLERSHMMEHVHEHSQQQTNSHTLTFRDGMAIAINFGGSPTLFLSFIFWAVATAFPQAGPLSSIMAFLITLLLSLLGVILVVRHVDIYVLSLRKYTDSTVDELLMASIGTGIVCLFLAVSIVLCLSMASTLEGWHYTLIIMEIALVGYQVCII
ncbi:MAG TPA: hypothetical protein VHZ51_17975 [Ktedonobacteraceae bacterium]|nr:hypothetical protein [Ktedonobacteraceae bacterium]